MPPRYCVAERVLDRVAEELKLLSLIPIGAPMERRNLLICGVPVVMRSYA
jgi:hypothetical protein